MDNTIFSFCHFFLSEDRCYCEICTCRVCQHSSQFSFMLDCQHPECFRVRTDKKRVQEVEAVSKVMGRTNNRKNPCFVGICLNRTLFFSRGLNYEDSLEKNLLIETCNFFFFPPNFHHAFQRKFDLPSHCFRLIVCNI